MAGNAITAEGMYFGIELNAREHRGSAERTSAHQHVARAGHRIEHPPIDRSDNESTE